MSFIIIYALFLIVLSFGLLLVKKSHIKYWFVVAAIALSVLAFFLHPVSTGYIDLVRFYKLMNFSRNYSSFFNAWNWYITQSAYKNEPLSALYVFLISRFPNNGFLPAITGLLFYGMAFSWVYKCSRRFSVSKLSIALTCLYFMLMFNYTYVTGGIRNFLAFMAFGYFLYMETVEKKRIWLCWIMYVALCFFHPATLVLLVFRILTLSAFKKLQKVICFLLLTYSFFLQVIIAILNVLTQTGINVFSEVSYKLTIYVNGGSSYQAFSGISGIIITTLILSIIIIDYIALFVVYKHNNYQPSSDSNYSMFFKVVMCFSVGSALSAQLMIRYTRMLLFLSIPYLVQFFNMHIGRNQSCFTITSSRKKLFNTKLAVIYTLLIMLNIVVALTVFSLDCITSYRIISLYVD